MKIDPVMYENSMIKKTGQWWKVQVGFWAMILSVGPLMINDLVNFWDINPMVHFSGIFIGLLSLIFLFASVKCPDCGAKWIWLAASKRGIIEKWGGGLLVHEFCPECKNENKIT